DGALPRVRRESPGAVRRPAKGSQTNVRALQARKRPDRNAGDALPFEAARTAQFRRGASRGPPLSVQQMEFRPGTNCEAFQWREGRTAGGACSLACAECVLRGNTIAACSLRVVKATFA